MHLSMTIICTINMIVYLYESVQILFRLYCSFFLRIFYFETILTWIFHMYPAG